MMSRCRGSWPHQVARWLWEGEGEGRGGGLARVARVALLPPALVYAAAMRVRAAGYRRGWFAVRRLPLPTVGVGNLSVGGTGKTPLAAWIARYYAERGRQPGILLRGYGQDEPLVHQRLVPAAVVVADTDRATGAQRAQAQGAEVLVLDDAFQLLSVSRDLNIAVVSAESADASPWTLPAGPWRESWTALARADWVVVTRKRATREAADALAAQLAARRPVLPVSVARLCLDHLEGMVSGVRREPAELRGSRVVAAAGIADPESFAAQLRTAGASVQLVAYQDHHRFGEEDLACLVRASAEADYVVITEKDAVKLRGRWPGDTAPEPLVAELAVQWERNGRMLEQALDAVLPPADRS